jgi:hypothetical protein
MPRHLRLSPTAQRPAYSTNRLAVGRSFTLFRLQPASNTKLVATAGTKGSALAISKGIDRDRAVDESGNNPVFVAVALAHSGRVPGSI